jgi:hypothetical protein
MLPYERQLGALIFIAAFPFSKRQLDYANDLHLILLLV